MESRHNWEELREDGRRRTRGKGPNLCLELGDQEAQNSLRIQASHFTKP